MLRRKNVIEKARPNKDEDCWSYQLLEADGKKHLYIFSLPNLKKDYKVFTEMQDATFVANLIQIIHFACIASYYKNLKPEESLLDTGIVHKLVHLLNATEGVLVLRQDFYTEVKETREQFKNLLAI